jgi:hypothetical protein
MPNNYGPRIITDNLVLCLDAANPKSYSGSGTTWTDLRRNGNNAILSNGPVYSTNDKGTITTDGTDDSIYIVNNSTISNFQSDITINFLLKIIGTGDYTTLFAKTSSDNWDDGFGAYFESGSLYFFVNNWAAYRVGSSSANTSGSFMNLTFVKSGVFLYIYKNASLLASQNTGLGNITNASPALFDGRLSFGNMPSNNFPMNVSFNYISLYSVALSPTQITQNYNALKGRFKL